MGEPTNWAGFVSNRNLGGNSPMYGTFAAQLAEWDKSRPDWKRYEAHPGATASNRPLQEQATVASARAGNREDGASNG